MDSRPPSLNAIRAFEVAARLGSFRAAAEFLNVTPSAVSHQIKSLEASLHLMLFSRDSTGLKLTAAGNAYFAAVTDSFGQIDHATSSIVRRFSQRRLTVRTYSTFAVRWLVPRLHRFRKQNRELEVGLFTSQADAVMTTDDVDVALRIGEGAGADIEQRYLFTPRLFPVAAPSVARRIKTPADLARETIIQVHPSPEDWTQWLAAHSIDDVDPDSGFVFDSYDHALTTAATGLGVALGMVPYMASDLASGRLVRVLKRLDDVPQQPWYLIYRKLESQRDNVLRFVDWIEQEISADPEIQALGSATDET